MPSLTANHDANNASMTTSNLLESRDQTSTARPAAVAGFAATIATWVAWWITHLPGLAIPSRAAAAVLTITLIVGLFWIARRAHKPFRVALIGGLISGALNLLILGSILGEQADSADAMATAANRFRADAPAIIAGYLLVTTLGGSSRAGSRPRSPPGLRPLDPASGWGGSRSWSSRVSSPSFL